MSLIIILKIFVFIPLLLCKEIFAYNYCNKLDATITQKVENEGYHRIIRWLLEIQSPSVEVITKSKCNFTLFFNVNSGMYVNPDEVTDLNRKSEFPISVLGDVDVESPSHESQEHKTYLFMSTINSNKVSLSLPIHLRYQRAQITGGFGKVVLNKPSLLVNCPTLDYTICGKSKVDGPCYYKSNLTCKWSNVTYEPLFHRVMEMFVPIGDLDDYPLVSIVTLMLGCAGCIYVLSILSTAPL